MRVSWRKIRLRPILGFGSSLVVLALVGSPGSAASGPCTAEPADYASQGYKVDQVIIRNPLDFFEAVSAPLRKVKATLPLQPGEAFTAADYSAGVEILGREVKENLGETSRVKVVVVTASLENCHDQKLDAVYHVFSFNFASFAAPRTEVRKDEMERPAPSAAERNVQGSYFTAPNFGYNASRHFFGGMAGSSTLRGSLFNNVNYGFSGSGSSSSAVFSIAGSRDFHRSLLDHADYQLGFVRSNMPSVLTGLRKSVVQVRFEGSSKPNTRKKTGEEQGLTTQFRYAASMEGGNEQSDLAASQSTAGSSSIGAFKLALGATLRSHSQSAGLSYGLQLGSTQAAAAVDYVKQVLDGEWAGTVNWPQRLKIRDLHRPIHLQIRGGVGKILINGRVPLTERFYGGNTVEGFLPGSDWEIRGGPFIRSIAQNRLAGLGMGGDSFASLGFTIAPTVWALPLVPRKVVATKDFQDAKQKALDDAVTFEKLFFEAEDPAAQSAAKDLDMIKPEAEEIHDLLTGLEGKIPGAAEAARAKAEADAGRLMRIATTARSDASQLKAVPGNSGALRRSLETLDATLATLPALKAQRDQLSKHLADLQSEGLKLSKDLKAIDEAGALAKAQKDMAVVRPVLDTFLNELDGLALSPVLIGDMASLHPDPYGTHYGLGFGLRFTFLNVNLTAGYAINPHPHPETPFRQGHGALFFSFEVSDLFR